MTKQFYVYVFETLFIMLFDRVDTAFGNSIGKDEIVAFSSFIVISWVLAVLVNVGSSIYDIWQDRAGTCIIISLVMSVIAGAFGFVFADNIAYLYQLTPIQHNMVVQLIRCYCLGAFTYSLTNFTYEYCIINYKVKVVFIADVIFYAVVVALDALVVYKGYGLVWIEAGTVAANIVWLVYMVLTSGVVKDLGVITKKDLLIGFKHAWNLILSGIVGKIATTFYNIMASRLGTDLYAIHCVCYSGTIFCEDLVLCIRRFILVRLKKVSVTRRYKLMRLLTRKYGVHIMLICIVLAPILTYMLKGDVLYYDCMSYLGIYLLYNISMVVYCSRQGYLMVQESSKQLAIASGAGCFVRVVSLGVLLAFYESLVVFGLALLLDFTVRAYYLNRCILKGEKWHGV